MIQQNAENAFIHISYLITLSLSSAIPRTYHSPAPPSSYHNSPAPQPQMLPQPQPQPQTQTYRSPPPPQPQQQTYRPAPNNENIGMGMGMGSQIPAPVPHRAPIAAPVANMTSPGILPTTWDPAMGIKFGGTPVGKGNAEGQGQGMPGGWQPPQQQQGGGGTWDPSKGMRFG